MNFMPHFFPIPFRRRSKDDTVITTDAENDSDPYPDEDPKEFVDDCRAVDCKDEAKGTECFAFGFSPGGKVDCEAIHSQLIFSQQEID